MHITIKSSTTIQEIQDAFAKRFPWLKIEFFVNSQNNQVLTADEMIKNHAQAIGELAKLNSDDGIELHGTTTVNQLELAFKDSFGLVAQVFHKRGHAWIITTTSDTLTLDTLNARAAEDSKPLPKEEVPDAADHMDVE
jgi:hypothetical protein